MDDKIQRLLDHYERLAAAGCPVEEASLEAGPPRVIWILMRDGSEAWAIAAESTAKHIMAAIPEACPGAARAKLYRVCPLHAPADIQLDYVMKLNGH